MTTLLTIVLVLHILCWAVVLGGAVVNIRTATLPKALLHSLLGALLTGILLTGIVEMSGGQLNYVLVGLKLVIALVLTGLVIHGSRNPEKVTSGFMGAIAGLTAVNVVAGVLL